MSSRRSRSVRALNPVARCLPGIAALAALAGCSSAIRTPAASTSSPAVSAACNNPSYSAADKAACEYGAGQAAITEEAHGGSSPAPATANGSASSTPTTSSSPPPSRPIVHFIEPVTGAQAGNWPFTAQLASVRTDLTGFYPGLGIHDQNQTMLLVQVAITDQMPGQRPPVPAFVISCNLPGVGRRDTADSTGDEIGWDQGPGSSPDPLVDAVDLGDGQPQDWDQEWAVPLSLDVSRVTCRIANPPGTYTPDIVVQGSGSLG